MSNRKLLTTRPHLIRCVCVFLQVLPPDVYTRLKTHLAWVKSEMKSWVTEDQQGRGLYADYLFSAITGRRVKSPGLRIRIRLILPNPAGVSTHNSGSVSTFFSVFLVGIPFAFHFFHDKMISTLFLKKIVICSEILLPCITGTSTVSHCKSRLRAGQRRLFMFSDWEYFVYHGDLSFGFRMSCPVVIRARVSFNNRTIHNLYDWYNTSRPVLGLTVM